MKEKFSLKDELFNPVKVHKVASEIKNVYGTFEQDNFEKEVLEKFPELELKERIYHIREILAKYLPDDYKTATQILLDSLPQELDPDKSDDDFGDFIYAPYSDFVLKYGCKEEYLDFSLNALREITRRFSVEFAIRDFINTFPKETLAMLEECSKSDNYHERRLVSESLRPKLPWAKKLTIEHTAPLQHLENLFKDNTRYVTRSVANHLNDISKIDAPLVLDILKRWKLSRMQEEKEMEFITTHALRTLVKQGHEEALALLGYHQDPDIKVKDFSLEKNEVAIGESLVFNFEIEAKVDEALMVDYILYFQTKAGKLSPKVHKVKKLTLKRDESIKIKKDILSKPI